jgi:AraC-like DNA-binding protein/CheY-like chemotaxis protein
MTSVLIVDDHPAAVQAYSIVLRNAGFETATAATGREGIALASARSFDVLLVEERLPDISGIDLGRELKRRAVGGRLVIVTAFPKLDSSFEAGASGVDGYVQGPLLGEEVIEVVTQALKGQFPVRHPGRCAVCDENGPSTPASAPVLDRRLREVMRSIDSDLAKPWSVEELAASVDLSESRLRHLFDASLGMSVTRYIRERRLQAAARRLITTTSSVGQIAYAVGFKSLSLADFGRAFRNRLRMSPAEYRARYGRRRDR